MPSTTMRRSRPFSAWTLLSSVALFALVAACGDDGGVQPDEIVYLAVLGVGTGVPGLTVPDTVRVGVPFSVSLTAGGGGCDRQDQLGVISSASRVELRPLVRAPRPTPELACPGISRQFVYQTQLTLSQAGTVTIVVFSRGASLEAPPVEHSRTIVVVP